MSALRKWTDLQGTTHVLAIGIDQYQHCARLTNAVSDARSFVEVLTQQYRVDPSHVTTLFDYQATKQGITQTLRSMIGEVDPEHDSLVMYYSGHGHYDQTLDEGYWVPVDAQYQAEVDYISYSYLTKVIKALPTRHTVLIVDSCYAGATLVRNIDEAANRLEKDPSRWIFASGRNEVVPDGVVGGNSPFAEQLLYALSNHSGRPVRISDLINKVTTAVTYNSPQTPIGRPIYGVGDKGGEFVFHPRKSTAGLENQHPQPSDASTQDHNSSDVDRMIPLSFQSFRKLWPYALVPVLLGVAPSLIWLASGRTDAETGSYMTFLMFPFAGFVVMQFSNIHRAVVRIQHVMAICIALFILFLLPLIALSLFDAYSPVSFKDMKKGGLYSLAGILLIAWLTSVFVNRLRKGIG
ncbi:MAG: caspase family protein [Saprospiraceae bacterium]|nr:caspase family protein [Saprospiraceae bacterium]